MEPFEGTLMEPCEGTPMEPFEGSLMEPFEGTRVEPFQGTLILYRNPKIPAPDLLEEVTAAVCHCQARGGARIGFSQGCLRLGSFQYFMKGLGLGSRIWVLGVSSRNSDSGRRGGFRAFM